MLRVLPNQSHPVEQTRQEVGYLTWRCRLQLLAWLIQALEEIEVVLSLHRSDLDVLRHVLEGLDVLRVHVRQDLEDTLQFGFVELLVDMREIVLAAAPVSDLIQWTCVFVVLLRVLVVHYILDLPVPVQ